MKTLAMTVHSFFRPYGGRDVINYENELKDKRLYVKSSVTYLWKIPNFLLESISSGDYLKSTVIFVLMKFDRYSNGQFWSKALNMHIFVFSRSRSIRIDILFLNSRHFRF